MAKPFIGLVISPSIKFLHRSFVPSCSHLPALKLNFSEVSYPFKQAPHLSPFPYSHVGPRLTLHMVSPTRHRGVWQPPGAGLAGVTWNIQTELAVEENPKMPGFHADMKGTSKQEFRHSGSQTVTIWGDNCVQVLVQPFISYVRMGKGLNFSVCYLELRKYMS